MNTQRRHTLAGDRGAQTDSIVRCCATVEQTAISVNEATVGLTDEDLDPFIKVVQPTRPSLTYERVE